MSETQDLMQVECECGEILNLEQYQYHVCAPNVPETKLPDSQLSSQVASCSEAVPQNSALDQALDSENQLIGKLAEAVQARPALWDHTLPLKERGKDVRERLWREVYVQFEGKNPILQLEKKWRNLKDTFFKHLKTYTPSGSRATKKKWVHFDILFFLAEKNRPRHSISNIGEVWQNSPTSISSRPSSHGSKSALEKLTEENGVEGTAVIKRRKKSLSDESDRLLLNILREPPPKPSTAVSPALLTIQSVLDKLPARVRIEAEIDMINKVYSLYNEFVNE